MRSDGGDERDSRRLRLLSARRSRRTALKSTHAPSVTHRPLFFSTRFIKLHRVRGVLMVVDGRVAGRLQTLRLLSTDARPSTNGLLKTRALGDAPLCRPFPTRTIK